MLKDTFKPTNLSCEQIESHIQGFIESYKANSKETQLTYKRALNEFLRYFNAGSNFAFLVKDIKNYTKYLEKKKKLEPVSVRTYLTSLRRFCKYLQSNGIIEKNPATRIEYKISEHSEHRNFLTVHEINRLLSSFNDTDYISLRDKTMIILIVFAYATESELINAKVSDLYHFRKKWYFKKNDQKIQLPDFASVYLKQYCEYLMPAAENNLPLFVSTSNRSKNKPLTVRGIREALMQRIKNPAAALNGFTPHTLRQTAAVYLAYKDYSLKEIMAIFHLKHSPTAKKYFKWANEFTT